MRTVFGVGLWRFGRNPADNMRTNLEKSAVLQIIRTPCQAQNRPSKC